MWCCENVPFTSMSSRRGGLVLGSFSFNLKGSAIVRAVRFQKSLEFLGLSYNYALLDPSRKSARLRVCYQHCDFRFVPICENLSKSLYATTKLDGAAIDLCNECELCGDGQVASLCTRETAIMKDVSIINIWCASMLPFKCAVNLMQSQVGVTS